MSSEEPNIFDTATTQGHSADVQIDLFIEGQRFSVGQMGRNLLIFDEPLVLPCSKGELVLTIDGRQRRWLVSLRNGTGPTRFVETEFREVG
jgi:hypothetical protein